MHIQHRFRSFSTTQICILRVSVFVLFAFTFGAILLPSTSHAAEENEVCFEREFTPTSDEGGRWARTRTQAPCDAGTTCSPVECIASENLLRYRCTRESVDINIKYEMCERAILGGASAAAPAAAPAAAGSLTADQLATAVRYNNGIFKICPDYKAEVATKLGTPVDTEAITKAVAKVHDGDSSLAAAKHYGKLTDPTQRNLLGKVCTVAATGTAAATGGASDADVSGGPAGGAGDSEVSGFDEAGAGSGGGVTGSQFDAVRTGIVMLDSPIDCGNEVCSIPVIIARVINFILSGIGAVAVVMLVYAGMTYMTSAGNEKRIESAKRTITYTILGLAVVFLSLLIVNVTIKLLGG